MHNQDSLVAHASDKPRVSDFNRSLSRQGEVTELVV
jgi:hypothetical protein